MRGGRGRAHLSRCRLLNNMTHQETSTHTTCSRIAHIPARTLSHDLRHAHHTTPHQWWWLAWLALQPPPTRPCPAAGAYRWP